MRRSIVLSPPLVSAPGLILTDDALELSLRFVLQLVLNRRPINALQQAKKETKHVKL